MADAYLKVKDNGANGLAIVREESDVSVTDLKSAIDYSRITYTYLNQAIVDNGGDGSTVTLTPVASSGGFNSVIVPCSEGDRFTITGVGGDSVRLWCFIDSNNVSIQNAKASVTATNLVIVAPKYAANLILNNKNVNESYKGVTVVKEISDVDSVFSSAEGVEEIQFSTSSYCFNCATKPSALRPTQTSNVYRYALVPCSVGDKFTITCTGGQSPRAYTFLDSSLNILSPQAPASAGYIDEVITAPASSAWLILNDNTTTGYAFKGITEKAKEKSLASVLYTPTKIASGSDCVTAFVAAMNAKAALLGMNDTMFTNPSGNSLKNKAKILDMLKMAWMATSYREILQAWSIPSTSVTVNGVSTSVSNSYLAAANTAITNGKLLGGKGGNMLDTYRAQIDLVDVNGTACALAIMGVDSTDYGRIYVYADDLAKMIGDLIENGSYSVPTHSGSTDLNGLVERGGGYAAMALPSADASAYSMNYPISSLTARESILYAGDTNECIPCSIQKVMTAMVVLDTLPDLNVIVEIQSSDIVEGSGSVTLTSGDKLSARDALILAMIDSNNIATTALARVAGNILIGG